MQLSPLSARSLVASILLGSDPPTLSGRSLVALGERFGYNGGTIRVALTRMAEKGELTNTDGDYSIAGPLLARRERQGLGRRPRTIDWDGAWEQAIVVPGHLREASATSGAQVRRDLAALNLGEVRAGVWMRPANLDPNRLPSTREAVAPHVWNLSVATIPTSAAVALTAIAFDLTTWATEAELLLKAIENSHQQLEADSLQPRTPGSVLTDAFNLASASVRHLLYDPQIPAELAPPQWPADRLRQTYRSFEHQLRLALRLVFADLD